MYIITIPFQGVICLLHNLMLRKVNGLIINNIRKLLWNWNIQSNFDINLSSEIIDLNDQADFYDESISSQNETHIKSLENKAEESTVLSEDEVIEYIFSSLLER